MAKKEKAKADKKDKKSKGKMDPLAAARAAKAAGGKKKAKSKKKGLPVFKAPEEFKPFFARAIVKIGKDGLVSDVKLTRIKGSPTNENAKTVDFGLHDPDTLRKFGVRYAGAAFVRNDAKRLPASSMISFLVRVGMKKDTGALSVAFKEFKLREADSKKSKELDKKDPIYRLARKPVRWMPAAFTTVKPFPSAAELKALLKSDEDDDSVETKSGKKIKSGKKKAKK